MPRANDPPAVCPHFGVIDGRKTGSGNTYLCENGQSKAGQYQTGSVANASFKSLWVVSEAVSAGSQHLLR
jgi:hypothetical protein